MKQTFLIGLRALLVFTVLTGVLYPLGVTALAQLVFPTQANGSVLHAGDKSVGSALIGQGFTADKYLWGRPSATAPFAYNAAASTGSNLGPSNPALADAVRQPFGLARVDGQIGATDTAPGSTDRLRVAPDVQHMLHVRFRRHARRPKPQPTTAAPAVR